MRALPIWIAVSLLGSACVNAPQSRSVDRGSPKRDVRVLDVPVVGHPVKLETSTVAQHRGTVPYDEELVGELIAVDDEHLWVLLEKQTAFEPIHRVDVVKATVTAYKSPDGRATALWGLGGIVSTISVGFHLLYAAPLWLVGGLTATGMVESARHAEFQALEFDGLYQWARFPQGMPPALGSCPKHPSSAVAPAPESAAQPSTPVQTPPPSKTTEPSPPPATIDPPL